MLVKMKRIELPIKAGVFWIIAGLFLATLSIYRSDWAGGSLNAELRVLRALLETLGISLVLFGLFTVILQTADWKDYFENHLSRIVIGNSFLEKLKDSELNELQTKLLVRQLGDGGVDPQESFLGYFHQELHHLISEPYREEVEAELIVDKVGNGSLMAADNISYLCRKVGDKIQQKVYWSLDPGEVKEIRSLKIELKKPLGDSQHAVKVLCDTQDGDVVKPDGNGGYLIVKEIPADYQVDGVRVTIRSRYVADYDRFHCWKMAYPTKKFCIILRFPTSLEAQTWAFVQSGSRIEKTAEPGYRKLRYDSWMLPNNGVTWLFKDAASNNRETVSAGSEPTVRSNA